MPLIMATENPEMFARTSHREVHCGHLHKEMVNEYGVSNYVSYHLFVLTTNGISKWGMKLNERGKHIYGISSKDLKTVTIKC